MSMATTAELTSTTPQANSTLPSLAPPSGQASTSESMPSSPDSDGTVSVSVSPRAGPSDESRTDLERIEELKKDEGVNDPEQTGFTIYWRKSNISAKVIGDRMARQQIEKRAARRARKANKEKATGGPAPFREGMRGERREAKKEEAHRRVKRKHKSEPVRTTRAI